MSIFKAYDVRGIYGQDLTDEIAYRFGRAFVTFLGCNRVVVGRDMRESSPKIEESLVKGLTDQGANVIKIGLATTPMLYFATAKIGYEAGINVTASHNPAEYNGFKLVGKEAVPIGGQTGIYEIAKLVKKNSFTDPKKKGRVSRKGSIIGDYVSNAFSHVDVSGIKKFKIVADTANGMAGLVIPEFLKRTGCEYEHMFPELDGSFPNHEANPLKKETLRWLRAEVKNGKADLGVAFDGDADRIIFVDEKANVIPGDLFTGLISSQILKSGEGRKILYDLRSSRAVPEMIYENDGRPIETKVGHSLIKAHMRREGAVFAGEVSGHYYFRNNYYIESPFVVFLLLLKLMSESGKPLSELVKPLRKYFNTGEINFDVKDKIAAIKRVRLAFPEPKRVYALDGLTIVYEDWWLNVRPSNTEPLLRLNLEARTKEKMEEIKEKVSGLILNPDRRAF